MNEVRTFDTLEDFDAIAQDFCELLVRADNDDIRAQFPGTVAAYTGDQAEVSQNLANTQRNYQLGMREQFVIFSGGKAVGMSVIRNDVTPPEGIDPTWPNISGFICNPYRGQGLGRLSMQRRMVAVQEHFGDHAWTYVKQGNIPSEKLVLEAGFVRLDLFLPDREDHFAYLYSGRR